jgi:hypothetical protein
MKKRICSLLFFVVSLTLTLSAQDFERVETFDVNPLEIEYSISYADVELDYYEISWSVPLIDSISKAEGQLPYLELHCFVRDSSGMIGFYEGLSTPMQYCNFQTNDSIVEVFFRLRKIPFSSSNAGSVDGRISVKTKGPTEPSHRNFEYESVRLNLNSPTNRKVTLLNDTNVVIISYGTRSSMDPLGMPIAGSIDAYGVISLDRYYLNIKTGRIATGQKWIDQKGPRKICQNIDQFLLVSPSIKYADENNNQYLGSELISAGRVKIKRFNLEDFIKTDQENIPY